MVEKNATKATAKKTTTRKRATSSKAKTTKKASSAEKYIYALGRRKNSSARVRLYPNGKGNITVNDKALKDYFTLESLQKEVLKPLQVAGKLNDFDITVKVVGGGISGQAGAVRHGIARALNDFDIDLRPALKAEGLLTRDPRVKERKKPGLRGARRAPQWSKR